jgi:hypothetical protein
MISRATSATIIVLLVEIISRLVLTLAISIKKVNWLAFIVGRLRNSKAPEKFEGEYKFCLNRASHVLTKAYSTIILQGKSNLVRRSL